MPAGRLIIQVICVILYNEVMPMDSPLLENRKRRRAVFVTGTACSRKIFKITT